MIDDVAQASVAELADGITIPAGADRTGDVKHASTSEDVARPGAAQPSTSNVQPAGAIPGPYPNKSQ